MVDRWKIHAIVASAASVWLVLALLSGQALSPKPLHLYSSAAAAATFTLIGYDRYLWRWRPTRRFTRILFLVGRGVAKVAEQKQRHVGTVPDRVAPDWLRYTWTGIVAVTVRCLESSPPARCKSYRGGQGPSTSVSSSIQAKVDAVLVGVRT